MSQLMKKLWNDQDGFILSTEAMILWTIVVLGMVVGLVAIRDAAVTELIEVANCILTFDQSYTYSNLNLTNGGHYDSNGEVAQTNGSTATDFPGTTNVAPPNSTWYGVSATGVLVAPTSQANIISVLAP
jgi:hypothetical protein